MVCRALSRGVHFATLLCHSNRTFNRCIVPEVRILDEITQSRFRYLTKTRTTLGYEESQAGKQSSFRLELHRVVLDGYRDAPRLCGVCRSRLGAWIILQHLWQEQLNQEGLIWLHLDGTDPLWQPSVQVTSLVERSDFVAALLEGEPSPNLYFELGIAMGERKPLLLFNDSSKVPSLMSSATMSVDERSQ